MTLANADILSGSATVLGGLVDLRVQFSAHPFPPPGGPTHVVTWCFDTDRDASTGGACGFSTFLGTDQAFAIGTPPGTLETCDLYGHPRILEASEIWFDPASNTLRLVFPLFLISSDPDFHYAVTSVFGGSGGANDFAPDWPPNFGSPGGFFTSDVGELPPFGGIRLCAPQTTSIAIDIKPGSAPNVINPKSEGILRVAILTAAGFDAADVDPATVRFGATGTEAAPVDSVLTDVDNDGDLDLLLRFKTEETGIACGATVASLRGQTTGGVAFTGSDSITTVGCQ